MSEPNVEKFIKELMDKAEKFGQEYVNRFEQSLKEWYLVSGIKAECPDGYIWDVLSINLEGNVWLQRDGGIETHWRIDKLKFIVEDKND